MGQNIKTYLRIKPDTENAEFTVSKNTIKFQDKTFAFDNIFQSISQKELFEKISEDILVSSMQGYNCTIFAYGQTGSGKTYTIQGKRSDYGLVQRCLGFLHSSNVEVEMSFVEIYNENMFDLFDVNKTLSMREDPNRSVVVDNITIEKSDSYESSMKLYEKGISARKTKSTYMNIESSRSHSVLTLYLRNSSNKVVKESKLCFVDLAGSERLKNLELENIQIKETANINRSLFCLGKIIHNLSKDSDGHIGYRDSKLTFLLKDSLGGNSKLRVIGNVCLENRNDTLNTLSFLNRLKMINNLAFVNANISDNIEDFKNELKALDQENIKLKTQLSLYKGRKGDKKDADEEIMKYEISRVKNLVEIAIGDLKKLEEEYKKFINFDCDLKRSYILKFQEIYKEILDERNDNHCESKRKKRESLI